MINTFTIAIKPIFIFCALLINLVPFSACYADSEQSVAGTSLPLWEVGLIPGTIRMPHYRGSDEYNLWTLPLPFVIYRGDFLKLDRDGFRGIFFQSEYFETNISGWGNPPMDEDNKAREGMSIPDAVIEIGPSLEWHFDGRRPGRNLFLRWALRSVISVGFPDNGDLGYQGLKSAFNFIYQKNVFWNRHPWHFGFNAGIEMGDKTYHRYFYEVPTANATLQRPAYSPDRGLSAFILSFRLIREINESLSAAGYLRWENLSQAVYKESPLVKEENNFIFGAAVIWALKKSETTIPSDKTQSKKPLLKVSLQ